MCSTRPDVQSHDQEYFQDQSAANGSAAASPEAVKEYGAFASTDDIVTAHNIHKTYLLGVEGVPALRGLNCCMTSCAAMYAGLMTRLQAFLVRSKRASLLSS